jgi:hypothetical protein
LELPMIRDVCYTKGWYGLALFSDMHIEGCGYAVVNLYQDRRSKMLKKDFEVIPR